MNDSFMDNYAKYAARIFAEEEAKAKAEAAARAEAGNGETKAEPPATPPPPQPQPSPVPVSLSTGMQKQIFTKLSMDQLIDFPDQPFRPYTPEQLEQLQESIRHAGILTPLIVRRLGDKYQILSGHNRRTAARMAGYETIPCIVRELDDDQAIITVVEANLRQREKLLPSEKAFAYKMKLDAMKHQGTSSPFETKLDTVDFTSRQLVGKLETADLIAENESGRQVQRYIRLTYLEQTLLDAVDGKRLGFGMAVTLSYLSHPAQTMVYSFFAGRNHRIDQGLADQLRALPEQELTLERLEEFLAPPDKQPRRVSVSMKPLRRWFPPQATPKEIEQEIVKIVSEYFKRQQSGGAGF